MLSHIVIRQNFGTLSIQTTPAQVVPGSRQLKLKMNQDFSGPQINTVQPQVQIDQTAAFASAGDKKPIPLAIGFLQDSLQKGIEAIGTIAQESARFLQIENGGNPVAQMSRESTTPNVNLTIKSMPSAPPDITVQPGSVSISFAQSTLQTDWEWADVEGSYTPHSIEISWGTRPNIEITVVPGVELQFPVASVNGSSVDEAI